MTAETKAFAKAFDHQKHFAGLIPTVEFPAPKALERLRHTLSYENTQEPFIDKYVEGIRRIRTSWTNRGKHCGKLSL